MFLLSRAVSLVNKVFPTRIAYAHCDIPCGIYDPHLAQIAAHTVVRMATLINELDKPGPDVTKDESAIYVHKIARMTAVKEHHAELAKQELRILWGDYFKPEHLDAHPNLHELFWNANKLAGANKQGVSSESARQLVASVDEIATIFWATKGVEYSDTVAATRYGA